jgi:hypothetical protein
MPNNDYDAIVAWVRKKMTNDTPPALRDLPNDDYAMVTEFDFDFRLANSNGATPKPACVKTCMDMVWVENIYLDSMTDGGLPTTWEKLLELWENKRFDVQRRSFETYYIPADAPIRVREFLFKLFNARSPTLVIDRDTMVIKYQFAHKKLVDNETMEERLAFEAYMEDVMIEAVAWCATPFRDAEAMIKKEYAGAGGN